MNLTVGFICSLTARDSPTGGPDTSLEESMGSSIPSHSLPAIRQSGSRSAPEPYQTPSCTGFWFPSCCANSSLPLPLLASLSCWSQGAPPSLLDFLSPSHIYINSPFTGQSSVTLLNRLSLLCKKPEWHNSVHYWANQWSISTLLYLKFYSFSVKILFLCGVWVPRHYFYFFPKCLTQT